MNEPVYEVLLVEDNPGDAVLLEESLPAADFQLIHVYVLAVRRYSCLLPDLRK